MQLTELTQRLADLGAKPQHIGRITRAWLQGKPLDSGTRHQKTENFLPLTVRQALPAIANELDGLARLRSEHPGADGSARLLVELADKQNVESVLMPRDGL
jgi:23S rRNA (adenine2503-C2)-methyltransferase